MSLVASTLKDDTSVITDVLEGIADQLVAPTELMPVLSRHIEDVTRANLAGKLRQLVAADDGPSAGLTPADLAFVDLTTQYGIPVEDMERGYRIAHQVILARTVSTITKVTSDGALLAEAVPLASQALQADLDRQLTHVRSAYRKAIPSGTALGRSTTQWLDAVVQGQRPEPQPGYGVDGEHAIVLLWDEGPASTRWEGLDRVVTAMTEAVSRGILVSYPNEHVVRVALHAPDARDTAITAIERARPATVWASLGSTAFGYEGLRASSRDAELARDVSLIAGAESRVAVTRFDTVGAIGLLAMAPVRLRRFVWSQLGELSADTPSMKELREAVAAYHAASRSLTTAAGRLFVHKNTLLNRLRAAEERAAVDVRDPQLDMLVALKACEVLGSAVLRGPATRP